MAEVYGDDGVDDDEGSIWGALKVSHPLASSCSL